MGLGLIHTTTGQGLTRTRVALSQEPHHLHASGSPCSTAALPARSPDEHPSDLTAEVAVVDLSALIPSGSSPCGRRVMASNRGLMRRYAHSLLRPTGWSIAAALWMAPSQGVPENLANRRWI
jgi:hypothetical protein